MIDPTKPDFTNTPVSPERPSFGYALTDVAAPPYVTIITPFYDTGLFFHETARSVLQQSFQQWKWLIINDGSTNPEALSILEAYRHSDPRIQVIDHITNRGPSAARNTGLRAARTQYVVQLDSDNLLEPTAVEKWCWFLESYPEYAFVKGYTVGFGAQQYLWEQGFHNGKAFLDRNQLDTTSMVRKAVHQAIGGYDESNRDGLEDWDFWLRCASFGHWGGTIPEYLDWYRRRPTHTDRWKNWDDGEEQRSFRAMLRQRYPQLWDNGFPQIQPRHHMPNDTVPDELPCGNWLQKDKPRLLMITTLDGDHSWLPHFARYTPDIFILHHFLRMVDYPRFLRYLICSRQVDVVLVSHSELGYLLLPYLCTHCPEVTFLDYCHIEEEYWKNGGYPRMAVDYQESFDLNVVSSEHLKGWMTKRGADPQRIEVCYINVHSEEWRPNPEQQATVRQELGLDESVPLILYVGRICAQKQPRVFAQTMLRLHQRGLPFVALVAGDGPDLKWLRSFIKKHKLNDRVSLLGAVSNQRIKQVMMAADVFFLPSQWEGIALSMYEAMACGLPVVGADVGGQRELVTPECGVLIARSDEETEAQQYAEVLAGLLKNPQRRKEMGQAGRARVCTHFRLERMGERMVALMEKAMGLHASCPRPLPGLGLGQACAAQAIEYVRLFQFADELWAKYNSPNLSCTERNGSNWREKIYLALYRWHEPYYHWYTKRGWTWLTPFREKIKQALLHQSTG
jgi:glycosyltransferase involved in cell wall biosynthesis